MWATVSSKEKSLGFSFSYSFSLLPSFNYTLLVFWQPRHQKALKQASFFKWFISPVFSPCHNLFRRLTHDAYHSKKKLKEHAWHKGRAGEHYWSRIFLFPFSLSALFIFQQSGVTLLQSAMTNTANHTRQTHVISLKFAPISMVFSHQRRTWVPSDHHLSSSWILRQILPVYF